MRTANINTSFELSSVSGLVLAGGQGSRMQSRSSTGSRIEKGLLLLHELPLVQWALNAFPDGLAKTYISANTCLEQYQQFATVVTDNPDFNTYSGPLAGIASALQIINTPWLLVAPVDVPKPPAGLYMQLIKCIQANPDRLLYYINTPEGLQPLFCLVHKSLLPSLLTCLYAGDYKVRNWLQKHGDTCMFNAGKSDFYNINTPADLQQAHNLIT